MILRAEAVSKEYEMGETVVQALKDANVAIAEGEFVAIMGPSGSGKSTLMNLLGALDTPTAGEITVDETDISELGEDELALLRSQKAGFVFQQFNLIPTMNAAENVSLPLLFRGVGKKERLERAEDVLANVGLGDRAEHMPSELSGGERQRVSIARALANDPDIVLADEPTGNLDRDTGNRIMELLSDLNEGGKTIIMVTHDDHDAGYADRIVRIEDGETGVNG